MDEEIKKNILKTGTSLVGIKCKDGIVMASDRQSTMGTIAADKNKQKTVQINDYLVISGAGVASDVEMLKKLIRAELRLKHLRSKTRPTIKEAASLTAMISYRSIRQFSTIPFIAGTFAGGVNEDGSTELYTIEPAGSNGIIDDYYAQGSGMPYILGLLERQHKQDMTVKQGVELAIEALKSSTQRDTGSGYGIDVFTITKQGINHEIKQKIESSYQNE